MRGPSASPARERPPPAAAGPGDRATPLWYRCSYRLPLASLIEENHLPVDDRTRLNLHRKLEAVLGQQEADTLMSHLPPVTWHDVATKDDVRASEAALRAHVDAVFERLGMQLRTEFVEATNRQIKWLVTFAAAWTSLLVTVVRLIP